MLRQRLDTEQRLIPPGPFPVRHDLIPPQACPLRGPTQSSGSRVPASATQGRPPQLQP